MSHSADHKYQHLGHLAGPRRGPRPTTRYAFSLRQLYSPIDGILQHVGNVFIPALPDPFERAVNLLGVLVGQPEFRLKIWPRPEKIESPQTVSI